MSIQANLQDIHERMAAACQRANRNPDDVRLVAVSKTKPAAMIDQAAESGQTLFGENYVQEFVAKTEEVTAPLHGILSAASRPTRSSTCAARWP